jgi:hypothetical protein
MYFGEELRYNETMIRKSEERVVVKDQINQTGERERRRGGSY